MSKRLTLLDTLNLRTTSVYRSPRDISVLRIIIGNLTNSKVPCTPIDRDGYVHHASDLPMQFITGVYVDGEPQSGGYTAYAAYQDETGHSIACVVFTEPQYEKKVSISGKGYIDLDNGSLIENPADFIKALFLDIQGYDSGSIDTGEIARFYADCLKADIQIADVLDEAISLKSLMDRLGLNLHSHWLLSDSKAVMKLRDVLSSEPAIYNFSEDEINDFQITSEPLLNEITVNYGHDFLNGKYQSSLTKHNPLSKRIYGDAKKVYDLRMIQTTRQAERVADAVLKTYSIPQILCSFKHNAKSAYIEPGDVVTVTHSAGLGENGYEQARGLVIKKGHIEHSYTVAMEQSGSLYSSELLSLTQVVAAGSTSGLTITYLNGVATFTFFVINGDGSYGKPLEGANITIGGVVKTTNKDGQVKFTLAKGKYSIKAECPGYEPAEFIVNV